MKVPRIFCLFRAPFCKNELKNCDNFNFELSNGISINIMKILLRKGQTYRKYFQLYVTQAFFFVQVDALSAPQRLWLECGKFIWHQCFFLFPQCWTGFFPVMSHFNEISESHSISVEINFPHSSVTLKSWEMFLG